MSDDLTFYSLLGVLQSGMWRQADIEGAWPRPGSPMVDTPIPLSIKESRPSNRIGSHVATVLGISKTTVAKMIDRLIVDRYLTAALEIRDKRRKEYALTQKARMSIDKITPGYMARLQKMSANVPPFEKQQLITILSNINFLDPSKTKIREHDRTITERGKEIRERCKRGSAPDIHRVMRVPARESRSSNHKAR